jgi:hypothetical protein
MMGFGDTSRVMDGRSIGAYWGVWRGRIGEEGGGGGEGGGWRWMEVEVEVLLG